MSGVVVMGERGVVKLGAREEVEVVGVVVCALFAEASGVEDRAAVVVGAVEGSLVLCCVGVLVVEVLVVVMVVGALLAVVEGASVGAGVRGCTAGGGGWMNCRLSGGSSSEALPRL